MIRRLLIANRGEIACRILRTAQHLGIHTIAVYSDADRHAQFVRQADEAWHLGPPDPQSSYLNQAKILEIARLSKADAIHPGYGFLAENAAFAQACETQAVIFVGPPASAIAAMGLKSEAKQRMHAAGVPLVPGYHGADQDDATLINEGNRIGFPLLIKASAGGGGKGMRIVTRASDLAAAITSARREARNAFGNSELLIERYIAEPRHVEVQIFCDQHGNGVYLHDRDCSIQRRHQKVIEEAPAPGLSDVTRRTMGENALKCAHAIGYVGAGTIEFLLDADENFYFMEMNTRLQVEHPVTEMITRQDLVEWQLRVAAGERLPLTQEEIPCVGHAIEARICAEDIHKDFLPDTGRIDFMRLPRNLSAHTRDPVFSHPLRLDTGIVEGDEISVFYDPMIAKLIAWHPERRGAAHRLDKALGEYQIGGIKTNISLVRHILAHPAFLEAAVSTHFIETHRAVLIPPLHPDPHTRMTAALLLAQARQPSTAEIGNASSPWDTSDYWQVNLPAKTPITLVHEDQTYDFIIEFTQNRSYRIEHGPQTLEARLFLDNGNALRAEIDQQLRHYQFRMDAKGLSLFANERQFDFTLPQPHTGTQEQQHSLRAPMNARIAALLVAPGTPVEKGTAILVVEAMKMEHTLTSPHPGTVASYYCAVGDLVTPATELVDLVKRQESKA